MVLNWVDYVLVAIIVLSAFWGIFRGFVKEVIAVITWIAGIWLAFHVGPNFASYFNNFSSSPQTQLYISYIVTFLVVFCIGWLVGYIATKMVGMTPLSIFNRLFGLVFGAVRGVLVVMLIMYLVTMFGWQDNTAWKHAGMPVKLSPLLHKLEGQAHAMVKDVKQGNSSNADATEKADQNNDQAQ